MVLDDTLLQVSMDLYLLTIELIYIGQFMEWKLKQLLHHWSYNLDPHLYNVSTYLNWIIIYTVPYVTNAHVFNKYSSATACSQIFILLLETPDSGLQCTLIHRQGIPFLCGTTQLLTREVLSVLISFGVSWHISICNGDSRSCKWCSATWKRETFNGFWRGS